jgi:nicotinamide phosphoribosyltransferase
MKMNPLTQIDFYKADHRRQYPEGTTLVSSNFTPRSNNLSNLPDNKDKVVFFGLQYFIKDYLINSFNEGFFNRPKEDVVREYKRRMDTSLGPNAIPVDHIEALHDLGYLPLEIRALEEGSEVGMKVPCMTLHNTHPEFFWLVNYIESVLSCYLWKPSVSATTARWYKRLLDKYAEETSSAAWFTQFQGHDFSFRGMSGPQDAALSGAGHLLSFVGTDTVPAIDFMEHYYGADAEKELIGCSVPATEHSVMCMGSKEGEFETFKRLVTELYPSGIVSIVSDTWDFWTVLTDYLPRLKTEIMARTGNPIANKVVIRPDSGDPVKIICGYKVFVSDEAPSKNRFDDDVIINDLWNLAEDGFDLVVFDGVFWKIEGYQDYDLYKYRLVPSQLTVPETKGAIQLLWETFGGTINDKGYKELDSHIGLIYGDSITPTRAKAILEGLKEKGFASTNVVFGIGSFTYQHVTRDTYGFAVKATYGEIDGLGREIFKDPKTDDGIKKSARGIVKVMDGKLVDQCAGVNADGTPKDFKGVMDHICDLKVVFKDGKLVKEVTLQEMRSRNT